MNSRNTVTSNNSITFSTKLSLATTTTAAYYENYDDIFNGLQNQNESTLQLDIIEMIFLTVFFIFGMIGNIVSIVVLRGRNFFETSKILKYLVLMDTLFILLQYITKVFLRYQLYLPYLTDFYCKFYLYCLFWILQTCTVLLVLINIVQLCVVSKKIRNPQVEEEETNTNFNKIKKFFQKNSILITIIVLSLLNIPNTYFSNVYVLLNKTNNSTFLLCGINSNYDDFINIFSVILITALPYFLILLIAIILGILVLIPNTQFKRLLKQSQQFQFILTTIFLDIFYLIAHLLLVYTHLSGSSDGDSSSQSYVPIEVLFEANLNTDYMLVYLFVFFFCSIKIIIYASVCQNFRDKLKILLFNCKNKLRSNRYQTQENVEGADNSPNVFYNNTIGDEVVIMQRNDAITTNDL